MKYKPYVWAAHWSNGKRYDLSHLDPLTFTHTAPARDLGPGRPVQPELTVCVNVAFSHHCFTNSRTHPRYVRDDIYRYRSDPRSFCPVRYQQTLDFDLRHWVAKLPAARCFRTDWDNCFAVVSQLSHGRGYYVAYFQVEPESSVIPYTVNLLIESAYVQTKLPIVGKGAYEEYFVATLVRVFSSFDKKKGPHWGPCSEAYTGGSLHPLIVGPFIEGGRAIFHRLDGPLGESRRRLRNQFYANLSPNALAL